MDEAPVAPDAIAAVVSGTELVEPAGDGVSSM
jgi:hypothetical protein